MDLAGLSLPCTPQEAPEGTDMLPEALIERASQFLLLLMCVLAAVLSSRIGRSLSALTELAQVRSDACHAAADHIRLLSSDTSFY